MESTLFTYGVNDGMELAYQANRRNKTWEWTIGAATLAPTEYFREWNLGFLWGVSLAAKLALSLQLSTYERG